MSSHRDRYESPNSEALNAVVGLDAALADRQPFTGATVPQVDEVAGAIDELVTVYPEGARYAPGAILWDRTSVLVVAAFAKQDSTPKMPIEGGMEKNACSRIDLEQLVFDEMHVETSSEGFDQFGFT